MDPVAYVERIAGRAAESKGLELVDVEMFRAGRRSILRVYITKEGGVSIEDCADMSRNLSAVFDAENVISGAYTLEVSSPGLDRPLKSRRDYQRNMGKTLRIACREPIEDKALFVGDLESVGEQDITLDLGSTKQVISMGNVAMAKLEIRF